uniref:leucine-rich colipase-like protein 1 n=1 Tax=Halichoerus grypus TaxID=9711 RepID=UPI0016594E6B|nr:leucine-rich colipase-like protein 1 [Halichoerus grypus]
MRSAGQQAGPPHSHIAICQERLLMTFLTGSLPPARRPRAALSWLHHPPPSCSAPGPSSSLCIPSKHTGHLFRPKVGELGSKRSRAGGLPWVGWDPATAPGWLCDPGRHLPSLSRCLVLPSCPRGSRQTTSLAPSLSLSSGSPGHRTHRVWNIPGTVKVRRRKGRVFLAGSWVCREGGKGRPALQRLGEACEHHAECRGRCCVTRSLNPQTFCAPRTILLQCVPWRKPNGADCSRHGDCRSQCCIALHEAGRCRCTRRSGLLAQCLAL